ncbi:hypothetical protein CAPTEDRAFT_224460 [Capitella teleta]|uniref:Uncharacterized protein n=1 Tax=Capitella teleta TaxID=283909 RepID=R7TR94_CAPTE|nr:hypothetical protein CAPTEDRAFT_224460 [Capitella teleta]|eukprot:ELT96423.1 hypothetical protein CAPTEDRAFT_224460 [Capitella teleta]
MDDTCFVLKYLKSLCSARATVDTRDAAFKSDDVTPACDDVIDGTEIDVTEIDLGAMMSEDSDYTSDINYPLQHQNNVSAHQVPREQHPFRRQRDDSYDSRDYQTANEVYDQDSFDRGTSFESRDGYPPEEEEEEERRSGGTLVPLAVATL